MKERKFETVLFDIDGTVLNTREFIYQAYKYSIGLHLNKVVSWEQVAPTLGLSLQKCYQILTGLDLVDRLMIAHDEFQYRNLQLVQVFPNVSSTLARIKKAGLSIGAVTSRYGEHVKQSLQITQIEKYFDIVVTPKEVRNTKPHPEPVTYAIGKLKTLPEKTVFVGDSPHDIQAGKSAGCATVGAVYGYFGPKLAEEKPDFLVADISEILPIVLG